MAIGDPLEETDRIVVEVADRAASEAGQARDFGRGRAELAAEHVEEGPLLVADPRRILPPQSAATRFDGSHGVTAEERIAVNAFAAHHAFEQEGPL